MQFSIGVDGMFRMVRRGLFAGCVWGGGVNE